MVTRVLPILGALFLLCAAPAQAINFPVTKTADTSDGDCSPTDCSLREAIVEANGAPGADTVQLPAGTYGLTGGTVTVSGSALTIEGGDVAATTTIVQRTKGRVLDISNVALTIQDVTITGGDEAGNGGGIRKTGAGTLEVLNSVVRNNRATGAGTSGAGGGGIHVSGSGDLTVDHSTVSGNTAGPQGQDGNNNGGGGIHHESSGLLTIHDSTIDGNTATVGNGTNNGGGGIWVLTGFPAISNSTISSNGVLASGVAIARGGGIFNASSSSAVELTHTIIGGNSATFGNGCGMPTGGAGFTSDGTNLESGDTCGLGATELRHTDPRLGALEDNGDGTLSRELLEGSPAIDAGDTSGSCAADDQRGVSRPVGNDCDIGAYEFDGLTVATIPDCSPTGEIPLRMVAAPGEGVDDFIYKVDGGPEQVVDAGGGASAGTTISIPEGRRQIEYWGTFSNGGELDHHTPPVLVDKTRPNVDVQQATRFRTFVIRRRATVNVQASDALSGLVGDPSGGGQQLNTSTRGAKRVTRTATDLCGNQSTDSLGYRVLAPALGTRAVLEVLGGRVRFGRRAGGSAGAAQKGQRFTALREPREVPVGSFVDTTRGQVRITSSTNRRTGLQAGRFSAGVFQVLQSRRRRARGLTELRLKGSSFRRCRRAGRGKRAGTAQSRIVRRLRANARGRFRTRGRHSAATVRGTVWLTADRCDGTFTRVTRGRVAVRDFRRRRTILLTAGKSFLARAP